MTGTSSLTPLQRGELILKALSAASPDQGDIAQLLGEGAEIPGLGRNDLSVLIDKGAKYGTPLIRAVENNWPGVVRRLLDHGADPDGTDRHGQTALTLLCIQLKERANLDLIGAVVDAGATLDQRDSWGKTALMCAAMQANDLVTDFLIRRGADPNAGDLQGHPALFYAISSGDEDFALDLLRKTDPAFVGALGAAAAATIKSYGNVHGRRMDILDREIATLAAASARRSIHTGIGQSIRVQKPPRLKTRAAP